MSSQTTRKTLLIIITLAPLMAGLLIAPGLAAAAAHSSMASSVSRLLEDLQAREDQRTSDLFERSSLLLVGNLHSFGNEKPDSG